MSHKSKNKIPFDALPVDWDFTLVQREEDGSCTACAVSAEDDFAHGKGKEFEDALLAAAEMAHRIEKGKRGAARAA